MNAINNLVNRTGEGFCNGLQVAAWSMTNNEPLEKVSKITGKTIEAAGIIFGGLSVGFSNFGAQIKDNIIVLETLRFIGAVRLYLICKDEEGKYFMTNPRNSWQKRVDRVNLIIHTAFKSWKGLNRFGFVSLGVLAKDAIGKLPFFTLLMDSFQLGSCFFSAWDSIGVNYPKALEDIAKGNKKIEKWEKRPLEIAFLKANVESECTHFKAKYEDKAIELNGRLEDFEKKARLNEDKLLKANSLPKEKQDKIIAECQAKKKELTLAIEKVHAKQEQNDDRLARFAAKDFRGLAADLERKDIDLKLRRWEVFKANGKQRQSVIWLRVANSVGKTVAISLAFTLLTLNLWTAPATLALAGMGIIADSIGLSKLIAEEFLKPKPLPTAMKV
jgi:hypothetical protein